MFENSPILTTAGLELLLRAIEGEHVTFTRFKVGAGVLPSGTDAEDLTDLVDAKIAFPIAAVDDTTPKTLKISGHFNSVSVTADFRLRELGLFAKGEDNIEVLYCYDYDAAGAGTIRANGCEVLTEQDVTMIISIDEATNISVELEEGILYALKVHTHSAADIESGILSVARGGTGAATLEGLLAGLFDFRERTSISADDLDAALTTGLFVAIEGEDNLLPFTHKDNMAMQGLLLIFHTTDLLGTYNIHQWLISDSVPSFQGGTGVPFGLSVEILRRQANSADIVDGAIPANEWSAWE